MTSPYYFRQHHLLPDHFLVEYSGRLDLRELVLYLQPGLVTIRQVVFINGLDRAEVHFWSDFR
jgi:hypothetical protein